MKLNHWKTHFSKSRSVIHFLNEYFRRRGIKKPTNKDVANIPFSELENSWISVPTQKEILIFQQQINNSQNAK